MSASTLDYLHWLFGWWHAAIHVAPPRTCLAISDTEITSILIGAQSVTLIFVTDEGCS